MNIEILKRAGIAYEKGLARFLGDGELYEAVLLALAEEPALSKAEQAVERWDMKALFEQVHAIKGMSGNMDIPELYRLSCELTELLRASEEPDASETKRLFSRLRAEYQRALDGIAAAREG